MQARHLKHRVRQKTLGAAGFGTAFWLVFPTPKTLFSFCPSSPQFIQITTSSQRSLVLLSLLWVVIDLLVLGAYILIIGKVLNSTNQRLITRCSGIALLLIALLGLIYNVRELLLQTAVI